MKNVLVLGSTGMAGHVITMHLENNPCLRIYNLSHRRKLNHQSIVMDVMDTEEFDRYLNDLDLDYIVNCIGILNQFAEQFKDKAVFINGYLPHFLENKYRNTGTRIIHLSTDCVFSGKSGAYTEASFRDGDKFYDRTKAIGEIINEKDLTFRTSIIGPDLNRDGIGLFNWFMQREGEISGYVNAVWTGITTIELAKAIERVIFSDLSGLYHLVPEKTITKYDLLNLLKAKFNKKDLTINRYNNEPVDKSLINTRNDFYYKIPSYEKMIDDMKEWIMTNIDMYPHYHIE